MFNTKPSQSKLEFMNSGYLAKKILLVAAILVPALLLTLFLPFQAQAATIEDAMCNINGVVTGNTGKALAAFAIVSISVGFFSRKLSWGSLLIIAIVVITIFCSPSLISSLFNKPISECEARISYTVSCHHGVCTSCPVGYAGSDCNMCATGFKGKKCNICEKGYVGKNCNKCDVNYGKYNGSCQLNCHVVNHEGIVDTFVNAGTGVLHCDVAHYMGSANYSCNDSNLSLTGSSCFCSGNYAGKNCANCDEGYAGPTCGSCDDGYTQINGECKKICIVTDQEGIVEGTEALPISGTLGCTVSGYTGSLDYACINGVFYTHHYCEKDDQQQVQ